MGEVNGHAEIVKKLAAAGASVDEKAVDGKTALLLAAWKKHADVVEILVTAGANLDETDKKGVTALM